MTRQKNEDGEYLPIPHAQMSGMYIGAAIVATAEVDKLSKALNLSIEEATSFKETAHLDFVRFCHEMRGGRA